MWPERCGILTKNLDGNWDAQIFGVRYQVIRRDGRWWIKGGTIVPHHTLRLDSLQRLCNTLDTARKRLEKLQSRWERYHDATTQAHVPTTVH